ncbi:uncharacterized protein LOC131951949 [Physella acuta]|uniref:uncharacterized protein LOC131951949 n=1 Tax=Physella acuta TaxID=109671 RepID=UPI0027DE57A3|nr:uncharacterized protein LOC131951949 [Physella acuta]
MAEKVEGFNVSASTCMETDRVDIVFKESIFFNFLWISSDRNVSEITNFAIVLMPDGKQTVECLNQTSKVVDGSAMKIWCLNRVDAKNISIKFEKRYRLCQLYVNGGRNLAPAGKAEMLFDGVKDDNIGWSANNPVNQRLEGSESCKLIMVFNESTKWALVFQPPVEIYSIRLVIESEGLTYTGFQLRLQSSDHTTDFVYNSTTEFQAEHNIKVHNASRIERAEFLVKTSLFLCKFEVFGGNY